MDDSRCIVDDGWQLHSLEQPVDQDRRGRRGHARNSRRNLSTFAHCLSVRHCCAPVAFSPRSRGTVVSLLAAHARDGSDGSSIDSSP